MHYLIISTGFSLPGPRNLLKGNLIATDGLIDYSWVIFTSNEVSKIQIKQSGDPPTQWLQHRQKWWNRPISWNDPTKKLSSNGVLDWSELRIYVFSAAKDSFKAQQ